MADRNADIQSLAYLRSQRFWIEPVALRVFYLVFVGGKCNFVSLTVCFGVCIYEIIQVILHLLDIWGGIKNNGYLSSEQFFDHTEMPTAILRARPQPASVFSDRFLTFIARTTKFLWAPLFHSIFRKQLKFCIKFIVTAQQKITAATNSIKTSIESQTIRLNFNPRS